MYKNKYNKSNIFAVKQDEDDQIIEILTFKTLQEAANHFGVSRQRVHDVVNTKLQGYTLSRVEYSGDSLTDSEKNV